MRCDRGRRVAGLEAMIALRAHLGSRVQIELLEANEAFVERQRAVAEPFGGAKSPRVDLAALAADHGVTFAPTDLRPGQRRVRTVRGDGIQYDALLIAVGATADIAIPGSFTLRGPRDLGAVVKLLEDIDSGRVDRVAFALPSLGQLVVAALRVALQTGEHVRRRGLTGVGLVVVTPERMPLDALGPRIALTHLGADGRARNRRAHEERAAARRCRRIGHSPSRGRAGGARLVSLPRSAGHGSKASLTTMRDSWRPTPTVR